LRQLVRAVTDSVLGTDLVTMHVVGGRPANSVEELCVANVARLVGLLRDLTPSFLGLFRHAEAVGRSLCRDSFVVINRLL
jgi:hypothetical protein